jgi:hypothetical protein
VPANASITTSKNYAKVYMKQKYNWSNKQFVCLDALWQKESNWKTTAHNKSSGAYGIPQALPGSKMGKGWKNNPQVQINWGLKYINNRYQTPCGAWKHFKRYNWY